MPLIFESNFIKVYNDNAYITVHYYDQSIHEPILQEYKKDGEIRLRRVGWKHDPQWRIFSWDRPRSNFEFALKEIARQEMKRNK
jgi:hypothetical protein